MMQTFDFIGKVWRDENLKCKLLENMNAGQEKEIIIEPHKLLFDHDKKKITISCSKPDYIFANKIVPAEITYETLRKMIDKEWK